MTEKLLGIQSWSRMTELQPLTLILKSPQLILSSSSTIASIPLTLPYT